MGWDGKYKSLEQAATTEEQIRHHRIMRTRASALTPNAKVY